MSGRSRFGVPGEDLPDFVAWTLTAIGIASVVGLSFEWGRPRSNGTMGVAAPPSASAVVAVTAVAPPPSQPIVANDAAPNDASVVVPATRCPPLVVTFGKGGGVPPVESEAGLARLALWLAAHPAATVTIDGHADSSGAEETNLWLSRQRAFGVRAILERQGVPRSRITARSFGSFWPADESPTDASWNRRVVVATKGDGCPPTEISKP